MKNGFVKVAAATTMVTVADVEANKLEALRVIDKAYGEGVKILVLPELCLTGYTCGDLFLQRPLLDGVLDAIGDILDKTKEYDMIIALGAPIEHMNNLYNTAVIMYKGQLLGIVPKTFIPNYQEFYEARHFTAGERCMEPIKLFGEMIPFGTDILFRNSNMKEMTIGVELCEDLWVPDSPSVRHALSGAGIIINLSASVETTTKERYRRDLVAMQSGKLICAYIYADAGEGESTTDVIFSGHNLICENGSVLKESKRFTNEYISTEVDLYKLASERRRITTFKGCIPDTYEIVDFDMAKSETKLTRFIPKTPFVPGNKNERELRAEEILNLQSMGLKKRLVAAYAKTAVIGISGGLDSTLALLVTVRAFDYLGRDRKDIIAITMPCFGTTDRTYNNACMLVKSLGCTLREVNIKEEVNLHFKDIEQDPEKHDVTYENSQARIRTLILMNVANKEGGIVVGTGDLSELALGWATYNGDHMSMYAVNASIPKTLVRHLVKYYADVLVDDMSLREVLYDVLDTPVSPELLPPKDGEISQKTEDLVGPYELHDFFLYHMLRFGIHPEKMYRIAVYAFDGDYDSETILKWLKNFYKRFFAQQFKRSCIPDGPKVGSVNLSPRGDFRMPSDASVNLWMKEIDALK